VRRGRAAVVVVAAAIAAVLLALSLAEGWWNDGAGPAEPESAISAQVSLSPAAVHFGDPLTARAVLVLDPTRVEAASVRLVPSFLSYRVASAERQVSHAGGLTTIAYSFALECLEAGCAPGRAQVPLDFPAAILRYRTRAGTPRRLAVSWPEITVASRLDDADRADPGAHLRADASPPPVSYDLSPGALVDGLAAASGLLVLAAGVLLFFALRRRVPATAVPEPDGAGRTPLESALLLVREASSDGHGPDLRRLALQRLVRELGKSHRRDLAQAAGRLAWSDRDPSAHTALELADRIEQELSEER
jgi:hypothetical protein